MVRLLWIVLVVGLMFTTYQLWWGRQSVPRLNELRETLETVRAANMQLRQRNEALFAELTSLENRRDAVEDKARHTLNMVRPNEILFRVATPETEEQYDKEPLLNLPDVKAPEIESGALPTFKPTKSDLYSAPKNMSAPKSKDRRE